MPVNHVYHCGKFKPLQAGHYFPIQGYDGLRYNPLNVNGECAGCNCFDQAHLIHYGTNLLERIGRDNYFQLMSVASEYKINGYKWSRSKLLEMIAFYKNEINNLK